MPASAGIFSPPTRLLLGMAACLFLLHTATNGQYGFHRDELASLDDARHLAWGYVAYPPMIAFVGRFGLDVFGPSVWGVRLLSAITQAIVLVLAGLMAGEMGGNRFAQGLAALATAVTPVALGSGAIMQYITFDYLWWVLAAYCVTRLLRTGEARWWVAIGAAIGLGMMTKYTMGFLALGIVTGVVLTDARRYLASRWLWLGVLVSVLIVVPNIVWQAEHHWITFDFLKNIHARDVRIGRTEGFLPDQIKVSTGLFTLPVWFSGLLALFFWRELKRFRMIGWMYLVPLVLFIVAKGRGYYMAPAYPMLMAAGAVWLERWAGSLRPFRRRAVQVVLIALLATNGALVVAIVLPVAPIGSRWFEVTSKLNGDIRKEIGWPDLTAEVARIWNSLPPEQRAHAAILATNYGEAGALDTYGPALGLPHPFSGVNSYWALGYPKPEPQTTIVVGLSGEYMDKNFENCQLAGHNGNRYGVHNEESDDHPDIYVCGKLRGSWEDFWKDFRYYG
jgi:hypothetical protein